MDSRRPRSANGFVRALAAAGTCAFIASCSTSPDGAASFGFTNPSPDIAAVDAGATSPAPTGTLETDAARTAAAGETTPDALPAKVAYLPATKPGGAFPEAGVAAPASAGATGQGPAETADADTAGDKAGQKPATQEQILTAAPAPAAAEQVMTAADPAPAKPAKKRGFLASLFSASQAEASPAPAKPESEPAKPIVEEKASKPLVRLAAFDPAEESEPRTSSGSYGSDALPGVRQMALFEIKRKSGLDDDSDVDLHEEDEYAPIQVASAAGLARLAPNGLLKQRDDVDVGCLKPALVGTLRKIERHFGRKVIVTSGYRSPTHNRRVRGAKNSQHMYCAAADIQVPGISKWDLASFVRSLPGRGGVGTYCHTASVHVDVGPERDWNWRCRRRKA